MQTVESKLLNAEIGQTHQQLLYPQVIADRHPPSNLANCTADE